MSKEVNDNDTEDDENDNMDMNIDQTRPGQEEHDGNRQKGNDEDWIMPTKNAQDFIYVWDVGKCIGRIRHIRNIKKCKSTPFSKSCVNRCVHRAIVLVYQPDVPIHTTETEHTSLIGVTVSEEVQNKHRFMKGWAVHPKKGTGMGQNTSSYYEDIIRDCVLKGGSDDAAKMSAAMILEYIQRAYPRPVSYTHLTLPTTPYV